MTPEPAGQHDEARLARSLPAAANWDQRYSERAWATDPDAALTELVGPLVPGRALDLGCGPGRNAVWLARQGWEVTGVDASSVGLSQARARARGVDVTLDLVTADLLAYEPLAGVFDLVVVANIHVAPPDRQRLFATAAAALAPGGHVFVTGRHRDALGRAGPPDPDRLYSEALLAGLFPTLEVGRLERHDRPARPGEKPVTNIFVWAAKPTIAKERP